MNCYDSIGSMIKWLIKCRSKTVKETAEAMGIKYTTFSAQLNNNTLSAETLMRLVKYLDIDIEWMAIVLGYHGHVSAIDKEMVPRMQSKMRNMELKKVSRNLDRIIVENPMSIPDARRELIKLYGRNNMFYLLDVLMPEDKHIYMITERDKTKFYVDLPRPTRGRIRSVMRRKPLAELYEGYEALDYVINERKNKA